MMMMTRAVMMMASTSVEKGYRLSVAFVDVGDRHHHSYNPGVEELLSLLYMAWNDKSRFSATITTSYDTYNRVT